MFGWGPATRIYLAAGATDMRKGFEGLYGLARDRLSCDPLSGHIFLFTNARHNRLKLLFWDGSGLWVCAKRLEKGRFRWPEAEGSQRKVVRGTGAAGGGHRPGGDPAPALVPEYLVFGSQDRTTYL